MKIIKALFLICGVLGMGGFVYADADTNASNNVKFQICFYPVDPNHPGSIAPTSLIHLVNGKYCYSSGTQLSALPTPFMADAFYAVKKWLQYVHPQNSSAQVSLRVAVYNDSTEARIGSDVIQSQNSYPLVINSSSGSEYYAVYPTAADALFNMNDISGRKTNRYSADIVIGFNSDFVQKNYWFDPQPQNRNSNNASIPAASDNNKTDIVSIFLHEMGHGFGIMSSRDPNIGTVNMGSLTPFDVFTGAQSIVMNGQTYGNFWNNFSSGSCSSLQNCPASPELFFYGQNTVAYLKSQGIITALPLSVVPTGLELTSQNYSHVGIYISENMPDPTKMDPTATMNSYCTKAEYRQENTITKDIMSGCPVPSARDTLGFPRQGRMNIQTLDLEILKDLGYNIVAFPS